MWRLRAGGRRATLARGGATGKRNLWGRRAAEAIGGTRSTWSARIGGSGGCRRRLAAGSRAVGRRWASRGRGGPTVRYGRATTPGNDPKNDPKNCTRFVPRCTALYRQIGTHGLLSRGSKVRVLPGAPFPKRIRGFSFRGKSSGECSSKKVTGIASVRHIFANTRSTISLSDSTRGDFLVRSRITETVADLRSIEAGGRFTSPASCCCSFRTMPSQPIPRPPPGPGLRLRVLNVSKLKAASAHDGVMQRLRSALALSGGTRGGAVATSGFSTRNNGTRACRSMGWFFLPRLYRCARIRGSSWIRKSASRLPLA